MITLIRLNSLIRLFELCKTPIVGCYANCPQSTASEIVHPMLTSTDIYWSKSIYPWLLCVALGHGQPRNPMQLRSVTAYQIVQVTLNPLNLYRIFSNKNVKVIFGLNSQIFANLG